MSVHHTSKIWKLTLPPVAKLVLLKYGDPADDDENLTWPGIASVARECGLSERHVQRTLRTFESDRVLLPIRNMTGGRGVRLPGGGQKGKKAIYRLDLARARELYRPNGVGFGGAGVAPEGDCESKGDTVSPLGKGDIGDNSGPINGLEGDGCKSKGDTESPLTKGDSGATKGDSGATKGDIGDIASIDELSLEPSLEKTRARDASAMDDGDAPAQASQQAPPQRESAPMANAVWRDNVAVLRQVIGDGPWRSWLVYAIPESDDGETLTLAAPTKFIATYIKDNFGETIEGVIDRRLVVEHRVWCGQAMDAHRAKEAAEAEAAKGAPE